MMHGIVLGWLMGILSIASSPAAAQEIKPEIDQDIRNIINELPTDSVLRRQLLAGARGDGVHYAWMDPMRTANVRRVVVRVYIRFDRRGKPEQMSVARLDCFTQYEGGSQLPCPESIKPRGAGSGVEQTLDSLALKRAAHGFWFDIPHPRPHPFTGEASVEFYDDEWLPMFPTPMYGACKECLPGPSGTQ